MACLRARVLATRCSRPEFRVHIGKHSGDGVLFVPVVELESCKP